MTQINWLAKCLSVIVLVLIAKVSSEELNLEQRNMEIMSLNRDGFYRSNPDELLSGFFAAWPAVLYIIGIAFFLVAIIAFLGYVTGICKGRNERFRPAI